MTLCNLGNRPGHQEDSDSYLSQLTLTKWMEAMPMANIMQEAAVKFM
jgi:hypothetical protein